MGNIKEGRAVGVENEEYAQCVAHDAVKMGRGLIQLSLDRILRTKEILTISVSFSDSFRLARGTSM